MSQVCIYRICACVVIGSCTHTGVSGPPLLFGNIKATTHLTHSCLVLFSFLYKWITHSVNFPNDVQDIGDLFTRWVRGLCDRLLTCYLLGCPACVAPLSTTTNHTCLPPCADILRPGIASFHCFARPDRSCK